MSEHPPPHSETYAAEQAIRRDGVRAPLTEVAAQHSERCDDFLASLVGYLRGQEVTTVIDARDSTAFWC
jgi:hypothetical protein